MDSKNIKYFGVGGLLEDALALMKKVSYESYKKPLTATTVELNQVAKLSKEQWDKIYFDTIKKYGEDSQEVKNIRDLHFSVMSGGDDLPKKYTHYTPSEPFNIYDFDHKPTSDGGFRGKGAYFETSETGTKDTYKGHPLEAYLRMNYTVDGEAVGAIPGQMDGPRFLQMLGHYKTKQEAIDHYLEEAEQKILQDIEYSKQNSLASKIKLKQEGIDPTASKEKLNKQISDYLERTKKDLEKEIPDDFDKMDSYQDSYETVVYNAGQMKSPQAVTRDDEGNIIPLSQRDDFSNPDMRFKGGGIIKAQDGTKFLVIKDEPEFDYEEPEFNFRHLNDELEAQDLDNYLTDLYYQKRIKYGQPDKDAIQEIQRHYNLSKDQIQETFDDLYNYGLGRVLTADLEDHPIEDVIPNAQQIDDETVVLKNGGQLIPKAQLGKVLAKAISSTGRLKEFGAETIQKLSASALATKDERVMELASIAKQSKAEHIPYPEEFVNYVDSLLKVPTKKQVDTKTIKRISSDEVTPVKTQNTEYIFGTNPETQKVQVIEIPKAPTTSRQLVHTGDFKEVNQFVRGTINPNNIAAKSDDIDLALQAYQDIQKGDFVPSEKMIFDSYSKSFGKLSHHLDEATNTSTIRHEFNFNEYPEILMHQITSTNEIPADTYGKFSYQNIQGVKKLFQKLEAEQPGHTIVPVVRTPKGAPYSLTERVVGNNYDFSKIEDKIYAAGYKQGLTPEQIKEAVENYEQSIHRDGRLSKDKTYTKFQSGTSVIAGAGDPYVVQYAFKNPVTKKLTYIPKLEEHHALALAEQMARAYLKNPKPLDPAEMLNMYKGQREVDFLNRFLLLTKEQHTGKNGIHYNDEFTLQDLGRIKNLSRMIHFDDLNELLDYYRQIVSKRQAQFNRSGGIIEYFK